MSITLASEGSGESYTNSFEVEVDAVESDDDNQNDQFSTDEDEPVISTEPNSTPFLGLVEIIALLCIIGLIQEKVVKNIRILSTFVTEFNISHFHPYSLHRVHIGSKH